MKSSVNNGNKDEYMEGGIRHSFEGTGIFEEEKRKGETIKSREETRPILQTLRDVGYGEKIHQHLKG